MSIWNYVFDSEYQQRSDIEQLKSGARKRGLRLTRKTTDLERRVEALEEEVGELALLCRSLLTVLRTNGSVDPAAFEQVMNDIDAEDGVIDGQVTPESERPKPRREVRAPAPRKRRP